MILNYQFNDVDAHGAMIHAQATSLEAEHQTMIRDALAAGGFGAVPVRQHAKSSSPELGRPEQVFCTAARSLLLHPDVTPREGLR